MTEDGKDALSITDDEDNVDYDEDDLHIPELSDTLSKWTNYIHGWQDRYIVVKTGTISYYKSEHETAIGCRGSLSLAKAVISAHEFDDCRFDVGVNDCLWYLRTNSSCERQKWIDVLELHKQAESGYGSENGLRRHGSHLSLTSVTSLSTASVSSFKRGRGLREKLAEMDTFREILCHQVDNLQNYFDSCATAVSQNSVHDALMTEDISEVEVPSGQKSTPLLHTLTHFWSGNHNNKENKKDVWSVLEQHGRQAIDFKGEAFTFKATTAGILSTLSYCIDLMGQREEAWKKRLDKEVEKRKKLQEAYKHLLVNQAQQPVVIGGPDFEEGPHSMLHEEEFFDAVDATLDILDEEVEKKSFLTLSCKIPVSVTTSLDANHVLYPEINRVVADHITHADMTANDVASSWSLIACEGEMKVYRRELVEDGTTFYPLKAVHTVKGITGHELCHLFWDPSVRMEWEGTLEASHVVEWLSKDTVVAYQVLKKVWPAAQRDSHFWSTIRHCPSEDDEGPDYWIVVNHSTDYASIPGTSKCVRILFNVAMICQTIVQPPANGKHISRENLTCRIQYSANVNPCGWVPASVIQVICKREAPKFLKNFTSYVQEKTRDKPILF